jgi:hypothetical protein
VEAAGRCCWSLQGHHPGTEWVDVTFNKGPEVSWLEVAFEKGSCWESWLLASADATRGVDVGSGDLS